MYTEPNRTLARLTDPLTSHEAAQASREFAGRHAAEILAALHAYGPMGASALADATGLQPHQVNKRVPELQRQGLADPTGERVRSHSGRAEREWRAV